MFSAKSSINLLKRINSVIDVGWGNGACVCVCEENECRYLYIYSSLRH